MLTVTPDYVTGYLKLGGSNESDVLVARRDELIRQQKPMKYISIAAIVFGSVLTLTIVGAIAGIAALCIGGWLLSRVKSNVRLIEEVCEDYIARLPVRTVA
ncbi:MAG: hypothetical protein KIS72_01995 [Luteimonas sp.]|nr:hypothetical protein [Luteimonas sp.]